MRSVPPDINLTADEIEKRIRQREEDARSLAPTCRQHQVITEEILSLRLYVEAKRSADTLRSKTPRRDD